MRGSQLGNPENLDQERCFLVQDGLPLRLAPHVLLAPQGFGPLLMSPLPRAPGHSPPVMFPESWYFKCSRNSHIHVPWVVLCPPRKMWKS